MRILRVAQDIFPDVVGGGSYHVHALSRDQADRGHDVTVLTVSETVDEPVRERRSGYTLLRTPPKVDLFGNKLFANTLGYLRDDRQYDVIHAHSHLFFSSNLTAVYSRFSETPFATTCHGLTSQRVPEWVSAMHLRTLGKLTYDTADRVFCYTQTERERLREIGVSSRIDVVNNGIDTQQFSPDGPRETRIESVDGQKILFVGRLVEGKRPQDVLDAFVEMRKTFPEATLFYCGDGPLGDELRASATAAGVSDDVVFLDFVSYETMPSVYRAADLLVLPSRAEGMPRTVLEALACTTPVVSSTLEQVAPVVEQAGETVPVGDTDALSDALAELLGDPRRRERLGTTGREIITEQYDWAETVERTTAALRDLAQNRNPPSTERYATTDGGDGPV